MERNGSERRIQELGARLARLEGRGERDTQTGSPAPTGAALCALPTVPERVFAPDVAPNRASLIRMSASKWVNGTALRYYFFDRESDGRNMTLANGTSQWRTWVGGEDQKSVVRRAFDLWKTVGIGIAFTEVDSRDAAEIRIGFEQGDGAWSYVGRDIIDHVPAVNERTMNFGWDLARAAREIDTAVHEIGHTLGFPHEHQNPNAGIVWDEEAVYRALGDYPNYWSREQTYHNIIRKISPDAIQGSSWDPDSIMHYPFEAGMILQPTGYSQGLQPAGGLSERDLAWVRKFYPALRDSMPRLAAFVAQPLDPKPAEQVNFEILPDATREYTFQAFGNADAVMVLFEDIEGDLRYREGDDDSGVDRNAQFRTKLFRDRRYVLRVRFYHADASGRVAVMMW